MPFVAKRTLMKKLLSRIKNWLRKNLVYIAASFSISESILHAAIVVASATYLITAGAIGPALLTVSFAFIQVVFACVLANRAVRNHQSQNDDARHLSLVV